MKFIVCGSGPEREVAVVKNLARSLHIEDKVEFRGWVDVYEKELALSESDCFILTSEDENFAIAAAEALAHGIPCILSSNVALSSLVSKYQAGVVFQELSFAEIENAILKVSTFDRDDLRDASLRASTEMSWDVVAKQWHSTINRLLKN
jgi:glycosyltransferase involved in cell wall biosynthesis